MAASRFQELRIIVLVILLCFFRPRKILAAAADNQYTGSSINNGRGGDGRSELCDTDLSSVLPPPYNNISNMICSPVWNTFILRYHEGNDNTVTFILSAVYTTGWVSMGFSKDGMMVGSSAMVGWLTRKGHAMIKQYYLQGNRPSRVVADAGELDLTKVPPAVVLYEAMIYLAFQAKFDHALNLQPIILAFGTTYPNHLRLSVHDDKTSILFNFSPGSASAVSIKPDVLRRNHGIMGVLAWGLFLPFGAIIARYLKHKDPLWYYLHAVIQFLGFLLGLTGVIIGLRLYDMGGGDASVAAHRGIGIFALTLSILQVLAFFLRPKREAKIRKYWNWYHHWFGRIALFFGAFNIVWGIHVGDAGVSWKIGYGLLITVIFVGVIFLETLSCIRRSEKKTVPPTFQMNPIQ